MANITTLGAPVVLAMPGQDIRDMGGKDALLEQAVGLAKESDVLSPESDRRNGSKPDDQSSAFNQTKTKTLSSVSEYGGSFVALTQDGVETERFPRKSVEAYAHQSKEDALREKMSSSNEDRVDLDADVLADAVGIDSDSKA